MTNHRLDLTDPYVREMADINHRPSETWLLSGSLARLDCGTCRHVWPCPTRQELDALPPADPMGAVSNRSYPD